MKKLSVTAAWNETAAFVKREFGLLFLVAFGLVALPTVILRAVAPETPPGQIPEAGAWMLLILPVIVFSIIGSLTMTMLALGRGEDARAAFGHAVRRSPTVLVAALLLGLIAMVAALPVAIVIVLLAGTGPAAAILLSAAILLAFVFVWIRMMLLNPVGAVEPVGPIEILRRSWRLTAGQFWKLLGFVAIALILFGVLSLAVTSVLGSLVILAAGQPQDGNLSKGLLLLLGGILNAAFGVFLTVMVARIYAQLAGGETKGS